MVSEFVGFMDSVVVEWRGGCRVCGCVRVPSRLRVRVHGCRLDFVRLGFDEIPQFVGCVFCLVSLFVRPLLCPVLAVCFVVACPFLSWRSADSALLLSCDFLGIGFPSFCRSFHNACSSRHCTRCRKGSTISLGLPSSTAGGFVLTSV